MTTTVIEDSRITAQNLLLDQTFRKTLFIDSLLTDTNQNFGGAIAMSNTSLNVGVGSNHRSKSLLHAGSLLSTRKRSTVAKPVTEKPFASLYLPLKSTRRKTSVSDLRNISDSASLLHDFATTPRQIALVARAEKQK